MKLLYVTPQLTTLGTNESLDAMLGVTNSVAAGIVRPALYHQESFPDFTMGMR